MTGRDLIMYILSNQLEDDEVFKDGRLLGFMTVEEAASKMYVGVSTIEVWLALGYLKGVRIGDAFYIPADSKSPMEAGVCKG